ncbi:hypothetical protein ACQZV8_06250 [Magnetococcales bacterium HHB-1]
MKTTFSFKKYIEDMAATIRENVGAAVKQFTLYALIGFSVFIVDDVLREAPRFIHEKLASYQEYMAAQKADEGKEKVDNQPIKNKKDHYSAYQSCQASLHQVAKNKAITLSLIEETSKDKTFMLDVGFSLFEGKHKDFIHLQLKRMFPVGIYHLKNEDKEEMIRLIDGIFSSVVLKCENISPLLLKAKAFGFEDQIGIKDNSVYPEGEKKIKNMAFMVSDRSGNGGKKERYPYSWKNDV